MNSCQLEELSRRITFIWILRKHILRSDTRHLRTIISNAELLLSVKPKLIEIA